MMYDGGITPFEGLHALASLSQSQPRLVQFVSPSS